VKKREKTSKSVRKRPKTSENDQKISTPLSTLSLFLSLQPVTTAKLIIQQLPKNDQKPNRKLMIKDQQPHKLLT